MKPLPILLAAILLSIPREALAWGQNGHDAVAAIAEANLTPKARAAVENYLGGRSIIYYSTWMDAVRHTPEYKHTSRWHSAKVDENFRHTPAVTPKDGDVITAVDAAIAALRGGKHKKLPPETVAFNIKLLVHFLGDMHCPVHVDYASGPNSFFKLAVFGREATYHSVWDGNAVDTHKWGYMEWVQQMNRLVPAEIAAVTAGAPADWFHQTALDSRVIYDWAGPDMKLEGNAYTDFINKAAPLAESQIQKAGYRLAKILNDCFGQ